MASAPQVQRFKGTGSMNVVVQPDEDQSFRLVYLRLHFCGSIESNGSDLVLQLDSAAGEEYDSQLYLGELAGLDADVNLLFTEAERTEPSPWSCQPGDGVRVLWSPPAGTDWTWGLEVGIEVLTG